MKLSLSWLSDFATLNAGVGVPQLTEKLIGLGHEIDGVETTGASAPFANVVVGKIISREQHPNADRLGVCAVDVGNAHNPGGQPRTIVCGAPNARAGLTVAVALPGAVLPPKGPGEEPFAIAQGKIRGVTSDGMICSTRELGLGEEHDGIWEMNTKAAVGTPLAEVLGQEAPEVDTVLEVAITPNRGDCLSQLGLAREIAAAGLGTLKDVQIPALGSKGPLTKVETRTGDAPFISGVTLAGVKAGVSSPAWVQSRLKAVGLRPRNAVVDATNYVMLALGQPLHAYDAAKVDGGLVADTAKAGETFEGLNETTLTLKGGETVIRDGKGAVLGLGGILGGQGSAVSEATTEIVLEAACFSRVRTALTGQAHHLTTDARSRFERGTDPAQAENALRLCAALIMDWAGGEAGPVATAGTLPACADGALTVISYDPALCGSYGGLDVPAAEQKTLLEGLGFAVNAKAVPWQVTPPSWRTTMATPEDLVEEVLRLVGYENIPAVLPPAMPAQLSIEADSRQVALDRLARRTLAANGVLELMTYSFIGREDAQLLAPEASLIELANPLAETSMTTMRPSLLPSLLRALLGNLARSESTPRLGEVGQVYANNLAPAKGKESLHEKPMAAVLLAGVAPRHWHVQAPTADAFAARGLAEALLNQLGAPAASAQVEPLTDHPAFHPGRSGQLRVGPFVLARFGEVHPAMKDAFGLGQVPLAALEIELQPLLKLQSKARPWQASPYPPVRRDLAFVLDGAVPAAAVQATLQAVDRELVKEVAVFDVYQGEHLPAGKKSIAFALTLQSAERTLAEKDIAAVLAAATEAVTRDHGGALRG